MHGAGGNPVKRPEQRHATDLATVAWRVLSSARAAVLGLALLVPPLLIGALLEQAPTGLRGDPLAHAAWLDERSSDLGGWTAPLDALGLFDVYGSWWFRLALAWLGFSLGVYVLARLERLLHRRRGGRRLVRGSGRRGSSAAALHTAVDPDDAVLACAGELRALGYTVRRSDGRITAARNRGYGVANLASHAGAVALLAAAAVNYVVGWQEPALAVAEGSTVAIGHGTGLAVRNERFAATRYAGTGLPRDYVTSLTLLRGGVPVREHYRLRVNQPLLADGVSIHQAFFGPAARVSVRDAGGAPLHTGGVPLTASDAEGRPAGLLAVPGYALEIIAPRPGAADRNVPPGTLRVRVVRPASPKPLAEVTMARGTEATAAGLRLRFEGVTWYSGLQVTYQPGAPWAWAAGALTLAGMVYAFAFPYRAARLTVRPAAGGSVIFVRVGGRAMGRAAELDRVSAALAAALEGSSPDAGESRRTVRAGEERSLAR